MVTHSRIRISAVTSVGLASLRPMAKEELAKTGDSTKWLLTAEYALVVQNPDAHAKVQNVGA